MKNTSTISILLANTNNILFTASKNINQKESYNLANI